MERFYQIAGAVVRVTGQSGELDCQDLLLCRYECDPQPWDHSVEFMVADSLTPPEGELVFAAPDKRVYRVGDTQLRYEGTVVDGLEDAYIRIARCGNESRVEVARRFLARHITGKIILNAMEAEHLVVRRRGFLLHASCIRVGDRAILFTAPSGTGKSTQADLWQRLRGAEVINGDRAALMKESEGITVRGIPFAGSSGISKNVSLPLGAIVYLSQGPNNTIRRLSGVEAFRRIWEGCSVNVWNREDLDACAQTVSEVLETVPVYHLICTPDERAVICLEQQISGKRPGGC